MAQNTDVTPSMLRDSAERHRQTNQAFKDSENKVSDTVDYLNSTNKGDLMVKLKEVHEEWKTQMEKAQGVLDTLAEYMDSAAQKLESRNASQAGELR